MEFSYFDNLRLDKKFQTETSSPLHRANRFPAEYAMERVNNEWPKRIDGHTIWACCVSEIGGLCNHLR